MLMSGECVVVTGIWLGERLLWALELPRFASGATVALTCLRLWCVCTLKDLGTSEKEPKSSPFNVSCQKEALKKMQRENSIHGKRGVHGQCISLYVDYYVGWPH